MTRTAAIIMIALCLTGCGGNDAVDERGLPALEDLNVVLVVIDTLGSKHLGCFDPARTCSPAVDRLASEGVLFTRALSTAPWTQPACASLMTGLMPSSHGVNGLLHKLAPMNTTLAELLAERGFATAGVVSHFLLDRKFGFDQGFGYYDASSDAGHKGASSERVTDIALRQLDRMVDERFFLFVHYFDPHGLYLHHEDFDRTSGYAGDLRPAMEIEELRDLRPDLDAADTEYLKNLYREEIGYTDHHLDRLLRGLDERGLTENTLVVFTVDHGEEFMEHGWIGHTIHLYDTLIHVPLIVRLPGVIAPGAVDVPVSIMDVLPTLLDVSRTPVAEPDWEGSSLWPLLVGGGDAPLGRDLFAEVDFEAPEHWPASGEAERQAHKTALMAGNWKLVHDLDHDTWSLFDRAYDPGEFTDMAGARPNLVHELRVRLEEWEAARGPRWKLDRTPRKADPETLRKLKSLGYVN